MNTSQVIEALEAVIGADQYWSRNLRVEDPTEILRRFRDAADKCRAVLASYEAGREEDSQKVTMTFTVTKPKNFWTWSLNYNNRTYESEQYFALQSNCLKDLEPTKQVLAAFGFETRVVVWKDVSDEEARDATPTEMLQTLVEALEFDPCPICGVHIAVEMHTMNCTLNKARQYLKDQK